MFEAYLLPDHELYLSAFINSAGDYEYTFYRYNLDEADGGIVPGFLTQDEALSHILDLHDLGKPEDIWMSDLDYETFECIIENRRGLL